jgi:lipid-binding SYLF domain-containing protein
VPCVINKIKQKSFTNQSHRIVADGAKKSESTSRNWYANNARSPLNLKITMLINNLHNMSLIYRTLATLFLLCLCLNNPAIAQFSNIFGSDKTVTQQRQEILQKNEQILKQLYAAEPKARELIEKSAGYATFSNFGMKILIAGGGSGSGVVINKSNSKPVYMNMAEVQAGLGIGLKSFQNIFIFQTEAALNDFINSGWTFGGQVTAAAKYEKDGGAYQNATVVAPGVLMYQLTDSGLAAEITGKGTKYYKDSTLNK